LARDGRSVSYRGFEGTIGVTLDTRRDVIVAIADLRASGGDRLIVECTKA
jgi:hypothetical protein